MYIYLYIKYGYYTMCEAVKYHIQVEYGKLKIYIINPLETTKITLNRRLQIISQKR